MRSLSDAIIQGNDAAIAQALMMGVPLNEIDEYGYTPLIQAAIMNNFDVAKLLIQQGAKVDFPDDTGGTALSWALENQNVVFCEFLLNQGANPNSYNKAGQPLLVKPLLRRQQSLKTLLYKSGAKLHFAQDYINSKLIGHRFELIGKCDIISPKLQFVEVDFEGFFLEFTLNVIEDSLHHYQNNFAAKHLKHYFELLHQLQRAFHRASQLVNFQHHLIEAADHRSQIHALFQDDLLLIPVAYAGHAITFVKYGHYLAKCDRGENSRYEDSVTVYRIGRQSEMTLDLLEHLMFATFDAEFVHHELNVILQLDQVTQLLVESQLAGNCSWANVEATVPTMLFLLMAMNHQSGELEDLVKHRTAAMSFYQQWREWDKDRALAHCLDSFNHADKARKLSKVELLGAILFQRCQFGQPKDMMRAEKIIEILIQREYEYVLKTYVKVNYKDVYSSQGENLLKILDAFGHSYY